MDGENNGKPYCLTDDLGRFGTPIFGSPSAHWLPKQHRAPNRLIITPSCAVCRKDVEAPELVKSKASTKRSKRAKLRKGIENSEVA